MSAVHCYLASSLAHSMRQNDECLRVMGLRRTHVKSYCSAEAWECNNKDTNVSVFILSGQIPPAHACCKDQLKGVLSPHQYIRLSLNHMPIASCQISFAGSPSPRGPQQLVFGNMPFSLIEADLMTDFDEWEADVSI